jgi:hypothetical protein
MSWKSQKIPPRHDGLPLDPNPTATLTGSIERLEVYAWRVRNGYAMFHPNDMRQPIIPKSNGPGNVRRKNRHVRFERPQVKEPGGRQYFSIRADSSFELVG